MVKVLDGVKVIELALYGFVPASAAVLADWGADVVKVEHPTGDPLRLLASSGMMADTGDFDFIVEQLNRNKRDITLDLARPETRPAFERLVRWADVFVTSFLPDARRRLRIEPDDLWALNPRLVYARGSGQGTRGPDAEAGGFDSVSYWARGGIAHMLSPADGPFVGQRPGMGDIPSGAFLAGGVAAALYYRAMTGKGITVDVSLLGAAAWNLGPDLVVASLTGEDPPKSGGGAGPNVLVGVHRTADERWLSLTMMEPDRHWAGFCRAIDHPELIEDPRYSSSKRSAHAQELHDLIAAAIGARPLDHWRDRLTTEGCIWSAVASPAEVVIDPQVVANGYLPAHPTHSGARLGSSPVQFGDEPIVIERPAPRVGEHSAEVLGELGFTAAEIADLYP